MALKISNSTTNDEHEIEEHIAKTNPSHRGYTLLRTHIERFEINGPEGKHLCLAYEPMREPLSLFQKRFKIRVMPLPLVKAYILFLLTGLNYLHTDCEVVHTGAFSLEKFVFVRAALGLQRSL